MEFNFDYESYEKIIRRVEDEFLLKESDVLSSALDNDAVGDSFLLDILFRLSGMVDKEMIRRFRNKVKGEVISRS